MVMTCTVKLDAELMLRTIEIQDERSNALLTTEFQATDTSAFQRLP